MSTESVFSTIGFPELHGSGGAGQDVVAQARTRGHAAGYTAGLRVAEEELRRRAAAQEEEHRALLARTQADADVLLALLKTATRRLGERVAPVVEEAQQTMASAAIDLAEAVVGFELADGEASARSVVARALSTVDPSLVLAVRMHPETIALLADIELDDALVLRADQSLTPGDVIVDFADGYLDGRISTALERAKAALLEGQS
ncbi:flagellar assembly protein FliH [Homoserinimonas aerilata]|uniref:Flagellar assembly protein FliH n=1 Tax=Homoserinimonas aerilata TaxID=1162970 RepID=A0A542YET9_9MICO|nr:FliH/SctL family protein [Homoserinimonas aerilata]TQL46613.1 flagellar assembly protein FliH [Homoserinimonas aerilata]